MGAVGCSVAEYLNFKSKVFGANLRVFKAAEILLLILQVGPRVPIDLMWELMRRSIATSRPSTLIQPPFLQYLTFNNCLIRSKIFPHCLKILVTLLQLTLLYIAMIIRCPCTFIQDLHFESRVEFNFVYHRKTIILSKFLQSNHLSLKTKHLKKSLSFKNI